MNPISNTIRVSTKVLCFAVLAGGIVTRAQNVSIVRANSFELGGFVGASYGGTTSNNEFRVMGGANATYAINKYILPYVEFSYFPGITREEKGTFAQSGNSYRYSYSIPVRDFHGGVHIRMPVFHEHPLVPYLAIGVGALTNSSRTVTASFQEAGATSEVQLPVQGATEFAVNAGGGIRYYVGQRFGFRIEAKAYKPSGDFGNVFAKVEGGVFFQLR